jgi:hypothetical protein
MHHAVDGSSAEFARAPEQPVRLDDASALFIIVAESTGIFRPIAVPDVRRPHPASRFTSAPVGYQERSAERSAAAPHAAAARVAGEEVGEALEYGIVLLSMG